MSSLASDLRWALEPATFAEEALGLELDPWQRKVLTSGGKRDLLNVTRQGGKSTIAAVMGLHTSLYKPKSLTLIVSPSQRQSSELFRKVKELAELLPRKPDLTEDNKLSWTVRNGGRVAALPGSDATIRGFSAPTLIVEDEAAWVEDDIHAAMRPMLAVSNGRMVLMSTPWGKRGHFFDLWSEATGWDRTEVPATAIPRIRPAFLEQERASMPAWRFDQEYMCRFADADDAAFSYELVMQAMDDGFEPFLEGVRA